MSDLSAHPPVRLADLFAGQPFDHQPARLPDVSVTGIAIDSRQVRPGDLFVARPGATVDGHDFIAAAIARGAAAVVGQRALDGLSVPYVQVEDTRSALTWLAAAFHGHPGKKLTVIGVTGTDGKTTTSNLLYHALKAAGLRVGMISTVNAVIGDETLDTGFHVTTPDAHEVQAYLARMLAAGLTHVVLEITSHGLAQYRADAALFDIGVVTNITHEHVNDHGSLENYRLAKARLFQLLAETPPKDGRAIRLGVLNRDDWSHDFLREIIARTNSTAVAERAVQAVTYGLGQADVRAENIQFLPSGLIFEAVADDFRVEVRSALVGAYNVSNILAALTTAVRGLGVDPAAAARGIAGLPGVPGRMERIDLGQDFTAIVDFAHTPNALKVTLETARQMTSGRVIVAFGSAGLRDRQKRRMMAEVAVQQSALAVLTAEDPRTESLDGILEEMAGAAVGQGGVEGETFWRVPDRGDAIRFALSLARPGDVVLACGKGHEQSMCFGTVEHAWDDRAAMRAALAELLGLSGPAMPFLPTRQTG